MAVRWSPVARPWHVDRRCMPRLLGQFIDKTDAKALDAGCLDTLSYVPAFTSFNDGNHDRRRQPAQGLRYPHGPHPGRRQRRLPRRDGQITGLLGPNGAGKTTTMRMLYTLMTPDQGSISVDGIDAAGNPVEVRRHLAYMPMRAASTSA